MTWILIFDHLEILKAWRIYDENVIQQYIFNIRTQKQIIG